MQEMNKQLLYLDYSPPSFLSREQSPCGGCSSLLPKGFTLLLFNPKLTRFY